MERGISGGVTRSGAGRAGPPADWDRVVGFVNYGSVPPRSFLGVGVKSVIIDGGHPADVRDRAWRHHMVELLHDSIPRDQRLVVSEVEVADGG